MATYESITYSRQDAFDVEQELRSEKFELEKGESAAKVAYHLCGNAALIGEFVISEEGKADILQEARHLFEQMCKGKKNSLSLMEGRILTVACVLLARTDLNTDESGNEQERGEIWQPILEGLKFREIATCTNCSEQVARQYLCDVLKDRSNVRFFAEGGQKYYNTLRLHALSPDWAIKNLYNVLYGFYYKNLECSYFLDSDVASMFVSGIQNRWMTTPAKGSQKQNIQSDRLSSSLRELFVRCPKYMAAVCDALLERIDWIAQGNLTGLDEKNRWDVLLQEWYQEKTAFEKNQMTNDRKAAVRRRVVDKKENICPEYIYENKNIYLSIPGIRLPEIQETPVVELYQNDQLIYKQRLMIYGNDVLWSTRSHKIPLTQVEKLNWKKRFCFEIRIASGETKIYHSGSELYREFLCFNSAGGEAPLSRCNQMLRLIVRKSAKLIIDDPEDRYTEEVAPYRSVGLWTDSVSGVFLNGMDILEDNHSGKKRAWAYLTPECDSSVCAKFEGKTISVYPEPPVLHVVLPGKADAKNYQITINDSTSQLFQCLFENGQFRVGLPAIVEKRHHVQVKDFDSGEVVFDLSYTIVPGLSYEFDRPFYLDIETEGELFVTSTGRKLTHGFRLERGESTVTWQMAGLDYEITVPKVFAEVSEKNAFCLPKNTWYEDLKDSFLTIRAPGNVNCAVLLGNQVIQPNHTGSYEIGVAVDKRNLVWKDAILGIVVSSLTYKQESKLTVVHFQEHFEGKPIIQDGRKILWKPEEACYIGGERKPEFRLEVENDEKDEPYTYSLKMKSCIVDGNFPCGTGTYKYVLWLTGRKKMFMDLPDLCLAEGEISVEDPPEDRFRGKYIILTRAYYSDPQSGSDMSVRMKRNGALIDDIRYEGTKEENGQLVHEYSGLMYFKTANGWRRFSDTETDFLEKINPVFFTVADDEHIVAYLEDQEPLMLNTKTLQQTYVYSGAQIFSRKNELTQAEQANYLIFADKFKFIERTN